MLSDMATLAGSKTLNWSANTTVGQWAGVSLAGAPLWVHTLTPSTKGLAGKIPAEEGSLVNP